MSVMLVLLGRSCDFLVSNVCPSSFAFLEGFGSRVFACVGLGVGACVNARGLVLIG
jgi:hypothetical protein